MRVVQEALAANPEDDWREAEAEILKNVDEAADVIPLLAEDGLNAAMKKLHTSD